MENAVFWVLAGGLAAMVAAVLLRATQIAGPAASAPDQAVSVYRDQLDEIDRDVARGVLAADEAERTRAEVARRLIEADRQRDHAARALPPRRWPAFLAAGAILPAAFGLYAWLGAPGYGDLPLAERLRQSASRLAERPSQAEAVAALPPLPAPPAPDPEFAALIERLRTTVAERPGDERGLELLAENEARLGNLAAAAEAQSRLIAARGDAATAADHSALAELLIRQAGGYVSPEAEASLIEALRRDPADPLGRFYSGVLFAWGGRYDRAFALWRPLLEESAADAPWVGPLRAMLPETAARAGIAYALPEAAAGPTDADIAAAADMTEADRQAMIAGMVSSLSDRLAREGGPPEDWAQLIRALGVLGRTEDAGAIYAEATTVFAGQDSALSFLKEAALAAGIAP